MIMFMSSIQYLCIEIAGEGGRGEERGEEGEGEIRIEEEGK